MHGDRLQENGFTPPWPLKEKAATIKGGALANRVAQLMSAMAVANAALLSIDETRAKAEAEVRAAEDQIEAMGIHSVSQISGLDSRKEYPVCAHLTCQRVSLWSWETKPGWRCDEHAVPEEGA